MKAVGGIESKFEDSIQIDRSVQSGFRIKLTVQVEEEVRYDWSGFSNLSEVEPQESKRYG